MFVRFMDPVVWVKTFRNPTRDVEDMAIPDSELKDIDYFNDHPDEIPDDPDLQDKIASGERVPTKSALAAQKDDKDESEEKSEEESEGASEEESDDGSAVATPSGKGSIPYEVLKGARQRANDAQEAVKAERAAREKAERERAELEARIKALEAKSSNAATKAEGDDLQEQINVLKVEHPTLASVLQKTLDRAVAAEKVAADAIKETSYIKRDRDADVRKAEEEVAKTVQQLIDENPYLSMWQSSHPEVWKEAVAEDEILRQSIRWKSKTNAERFAQVVENVLSALPDAPRPKGEPKPTQEQLQAAAEKKIAEAKKGKGKPPLSISDLKGGTPPAADEIGNLDDAPVQDLEQLATKNYARFEEILNRIS